MPTKPTIEHGIQYGVMRQSWDYPYDDMAIGDSFYIPQTESVATTVRQRLYTRNKKHPQTVFRAKKAWIGDDLGQRVWRLK